jgi:hypothetical protein
MVNVRYLRFLAILLMTTLSCEAEAQKPFDPTKIVGFPSFPSAAKPPATPPGIPSWAPAFKQQVERCWKVPVIAGNQPSVKVEFILHLKRDGTLEGPPILGPSNGPLTPYHEAYQQSAQRAIVDCQPYRLPADQFDQWKNFNPVFATSKSGAQR